MIPQLVGLGAGCLVMVWVSRLIRRLRARIHAHRRARSLFRMFMHKEKKS